MQYLIDSVLYSYAQIFFSNRKWFGAIALLSTFIIPVLGLGALLGVILSNLMAHLLKFDSLKIKSGFYGFNGILFGLAAVYYFQIDSFLLMIILVFIIITFFISAVLENYLAVAFNLPGLSLPFIISLYIFIVFLTNYNFINPAAINYSEPEVIEALPYYIKAYFKSVALILFQPSIISGIILVAGILLFSRILFLLSVFSFTLSSLFLKIFLPETSDSLLILAGFNSILTGFALGGSLILPSKKSFLLVIISSLTVIIFTGFFYKLLFTTNLNNGINLPVLVLPFNFIVLSVLYSLKFRKEQTDLVLLYFTPGSPEENHYYHENKRARFDKFKFIYPELPFYGEWKVSQGINGEYTHKDDWKYAWDFVVVDEKDKQYDYEGYQLSDYYCYRLPVTAPLDGEVVLLTESTPNNKVGDINTEKNWGNTVILKHEYGLFSSISHLEPNSIKVKEGEKVKKGDLLALCGNSGRSPYPHIHFQFQTNEKLGDKTFLFPFAHFIEKSESPLELPAGTPPVGIEMNKDKLSVATSHQIGSLSKSELILKTFDFPVQGTIVQNLDTHKTLKHAFDFKYGDTLSFEYTPKQPMFSQGAQSEQSENNKTIVENWNVGIDMYSSFYITNQFGDILHFFNSNKIFYINSYAGSKNSALYYFFISALQVPLSFHKNLVWNDVYSPAQITNSFVRYISEFLLVFDNFITAKGEFRFDEPFGQTKQEKDKDEITINSQISINGKSIFKFYQKKFSGKLLIDKDGFISQISFSDEKEIVFTAKRVNLNKR